LSNSLIEEGICPGSERFLKTLGLQLNVTMDHQVRDLFSSNFPILLIGEHPSFLGFDFFAVAASTADIPNHSGKLYFLGWLLAQGIIPGFHPWMFPITVTPEEFGPLPTNEHRFGPFTDWVQACAPQISGYQSARFNAKSLRSFTQSWMNGNRVLIFPDGGPVTVPHWRSGLGRVLIQAKKVAKQRPSFDLYILFFRVEGADDRLLLNPPILSRYHLLRLFFRPKRKSIVVRYGIPMRLKEIGKTLSSQSPRAIVESLQKKYKQQLGENP